MVLLFCGLMWAHGLVAFPQSPELDSLATEVNDMIYRAKTDYAQVVVLEFLQREDLTELERYRAYLLYSETIRASGQPNNAMGALVWAKKLGEILPDSASYVSNVNMKIAGLYFDIQDFEKAKIYAEKSVRTPANTELMPVGHAANYLMLGYYDYIKGNFAEARTRYEQARNEYLRLGAGCELPLYHTKMASLMSRQNKPDSAMLFIDSARTSVEMCDILAYAIITEQTLYTIQKERGLFKEAVNTVEKLSELRKTMRQTKQRTQMQMLERNYEMRLQNAEIENLTKLNAQKEVALSEQRRNLLVAIVGLIGLGILAALLIVVNHRRRSAMAALGELNEQLEEKVKTRTAHLDKANKGLSKHTQAVEKRNRQLMDFYHIITHNLRAPLGNLSMLVKLQRESKDRELQKELVDNTAEVVDDMNHTVNDLLHAIQYTATSDAEAFPVKFSDALERIEEDLRRDNANVEFELKSDFSEAQKVVYPPKFLVSLFHNLLSNAIKYRSESRSLRIEVKTTKTDEGIVLEVKDNGMGLDLDQCGHKLFKAGQYFHDHPEAKGFGLYMTRLQVENQGGRIWMESEPDQGCSVFVAFSPDATV